MEKKNSRRTLNPVAALRALRNLAPAQLALPTETPDTGVIHFREGEGLRPKAHAEAAVPWALRVSAAVSWRMIVVAVAAAGLTWLAMQLSMIIMPVAVALLIAVLLDPLVAWFHRRLHIGRTTSAALGLILSVLFVVLVLSQALSGIIKQVPTLLSEANDGLQRFTQWLTTNPFGIDMSGAEQTIQMLQTEVTSWLQRNSTTLASGALSVTTSVLSIAASTLIMVFCLFFFLKDGRTIWLWIVRLLPAPAREPLHESAIRGWVTLGGYVRTQIKVAAIDAVGIGIGAFLLGVPMALPITVVVFFGSFIPIVGAMTSGAIAVFVAIVDQGPTAGLIMMAIILGVQQFEGNVLQPWLMSSAVSLHPLAVLLVVAGAGSVAGIPGALFGVPIAAFLNSTFLYLHGYDPIPSLRTDRDRPGGPPGMLNEMIIATYSDKGSAFVEEDLELAKNAPEGTGTPAGSTPASGAGTAGTSSKTTTAHEATAAAQRGAGAPSRETPKEGAYLATGGAGGAGKAAVPQEATPPGKEDGAAPSSERRENPPPSKKDSSSGSH
ncbi:AI-2E family transporter [Schaalia sp. Marseille-Q2122]|uniref:AI-2E family transporter n=1 Tax=Schaalia sp. Marseille-Q2122 TaxID=2736604 RepID=UPI0015892A56|nr:AI-2E family transporter [Schaalia sp. Marseille-Q2122]